MEYTEKIQKAIKFAIKTHELYQKQKRKGKDIAYIIHPLTVGIILSQIRANEDVIIAGILHDTIEDSIDDKKVSAQMLEDRFGKNVSNLVVSVTEQDKNLSWQERKKQGLEHINNFSTDSLLIKSADIINNASELIDDYKRYGDKVFKNFNATKEQKIQNYLEMINTIINKWSENPFLEDLNFIYKELKEI